MGLTPLSRAAILVFVVQCVLPMSATSADKLSYTVREELPGGTFVGNLTRDVGVKLPEIRFDFLNDVSSRADLFHVDPDSGILVTSQQIDRDVMCANQPECVVPLNIQLKASQMFKIIKIQVAISDINDNTPAFQDLAAFRSLSESAQPGTKLILPSAADPDGPEFGVKKYELVGGEGVFALTAVNINDGGGDDVQLMLVSDLDRELRDVYRMRLFAIDGGSPSKSGSLDVNIRVLDANDNSPKFDRTSYDVTVQEDVNQTTAIVYVQANDPDLGMNGKVIYEFTNNTRQAYGDTFQINNVTGAVRVVGKLDYKRQSIYELHVTARDGGHESVVTIAKLTVRVQDTNDHAPEIWIKTIMREDGKLTIPENSRNNSFVAHIRVKDLDVGKNGEYTCTLDSEYFTLEELYKTDYKVVTAAVFDRESRDEYVITITCTDEGQEPKSSSLRMTIAVTDVNDHRPTFERKLTYAELEEGNKTGSRVIEMLARDSDTGPNGRVTYSLIDDHRGLFLIDPDSGIIICNGILDRERLSNFNLTVVATDAGTPPLSETAVVIVQVIDVDDEPPVFASATYRFEVAENEAAGLVVGQVNAVDPDEPGHNDFYYVVTNASEGFRDLFVLDPLTGTIRTSGVLDREMTSTYDAVISATSTTVNRDSTVTFTNHTLIHISVSDINDNPPQFIYPSFTDYHLTVDPEMLVAGQVITRIRATDNDTDANVVCEYQIVGAKPGGDILTLDPYNGSLILGRDPDRIPDRTFSIDVVAYDCGTPRLNGTGTLVVTFVRLRLGGALSPNTVIVVVISVITLITVAVLVFLIARVIRKRRARKYNWIPRVIDIKIKTVAESVEGGGSLEKCDEIGIKNTFSPFPEDESQTPTEDLIDSGTTEKDFLPPGDANYFDQDSGCGSAVGAGSNTPSGTGSLPEWTDTDISSVINDIKGSDPGRLTSTAQIPAGRMAPRAHECDGLRLFSTLDVAKELPPWEQPQQPEGGSLPHTAGRRVEGGKPPRQTQVRFRLPPDVSSLASSESLNHAVETGP
ncbi:hypothetical protein LSH36_48g04005 [Paralvinella palmiformis]|uniref:Cadherin domain-containing protein n=1 Tax=Paralvinella palmiformis TaxID=53620 RepID=A0AAD9NCT4_9ANNE|nr:hypothetical protein LSH36_48g04005 [Paralvinella palmiformis]